MGKLFVCLFVVVLKRENENSINHISYCDENCDWRFRVLGHHSQL
jgi:hypothetical protein